LGGRLAFFLFSQAGEKPADLVVAVQLVQMLPLSVPRHCHIRGQLRRLADTRMDLLLRALFHVLELLALLLCQRREQLVHLGREPRLRVGVFREVRVAERSEPRKVNRLHRCGAPSTF